MSLLNANKFLKGYLRKVEIKEELPESISFQKDALIKEFKSLTKKMEGYVSKITQSEFEEVLEDTLCTEYVDLKWSIDNLI